MFDIITLMKSINIYQADAFTSVPFRGNPAAVVIDADSLNEKEMMDIANEMNLDETVFVLKPTDDKSVIRLRFFTPQNIEILFTGHATVGALFELARLQMFGLGREGKNEITIETKAGILTMWTQVHKNSIQVIMNVPQIKLDAYLMQGDAFAQAFGISSQAITRGKKILLDTYLKYIYIPITDLSTLGELKFNFPRICKEFAEAGIILFCLYTPEAFDKDCMLHSRVVAPLIGFTAEDSFTGSTQAGVCTAARQQGLLDASINEYKVEQGDFTGRPGRAWVVFDPISHTPYIKATATHIFSTVINF